MIPAMGNHRKNFMFRSSEERALDACCIRWARIVLGQLWDSSGKVPGMIVPGYKPQVDKSVDAVYNLSLIHISEPTRPY